MRGIDLGPCRRQDANLRGERKRKGKGKGKRKRKRKREKGKGRRRRRRGDLTDTLGVVSGAPSTSASTTPQGPPPARSGAGVSAPPFPLRRHSRRDRHAGARGGSRLPPPARANVALTGDLPLIFSSEDSFSPLERVVVL